PSAMRRATAPATTDDCLRLVLAYRPPLAWSSLLRYLALRAIPGVECVEAGTYHRTVAIGEQRGWLKVSAVDEKSLLAVELSTSLLPLLASVLARVRQLFDLDAQPQAIAAHLAGDPRLAALLRR